MNLALKLFVQSDIVAHFSHLISSRHLIGVESSACCDANKLIADGLKVRNNIKHKKDRNLRTRVNGEVRESGNKSNRPNVKQTNRKCV